MTTRRGFLKTLLSAASAIASGVVPNLVPRQRRDLSYLNVRPIDLGMAKEAGRRVAEEIERCVLGVPSKYTYGGSRITHIDLKSLPMPAIYPYMRKWIKS